MHLKIHFENFLLLVQVIGSPWILHQLYSDAVCLFWVALLFIGLVMRIQSAFLPLYWVIFFSLGNIVRQKLLSEWKGIYFFLSNKVHIESYSC